MSTKTDSSSLLGTWLEGLSPDAVESWVQDRLAGRDARFPIRESEESRGEILLRLAEGRALSDPLITRLAAVIDRATIDQVTRAAPDLREFSETLALYGRFPGTGCVGAIRSVIGTSLWTSVYWTDHDLDIRVVNALACKASRVDREFWMHLAGQPRTGEAAIAALWRRMDGKLRWMPWSRTCMCSGIPRFRPGSRSA